MIKYAERPRIATTPQVLLNANGSSARAMALAFLSFESAYWRGEATSAFATRLGSYWQPDLPPMPAAVPDAFSPHGASGRGISWYEMHGVVFGYSGGARRGYCIPVVAIPGLVHSSPGVASTTATTSASARDPLRGRCAA